MPPLRGPLRKKKSHLWERQTEDWYVEPRWVSNRLFETEKFGPRVYDPSCGMGTILHAAQSAGYDTCGSDIVEREDVSLWHEFQLNDFVENGAAFENADIVSNPPFGLCNRAAKDAAYDDYAYVKRALAQAKNKLALLLPTSWMCGGHRSVWLEQTPLRRVLVLGPRPSMPPGHVVLASGKPGSGTTDYAWYVWEIGYRGKPELQWLRRDA